MDPASIRADSAALPWRATPCAGVSWKKLRFDPASGESAVLLRFAPGAAYDAHRHPGGEQYLVLEGTLRDGEHTWGPGSYVWHPPGSAHRPASDEGCVVFVVLPRPIELLDAAGAESPGGGPSAGNAS
jgi:anti-sigma factor ChrR (cupin superfamily)